MRVMSRDFTLKEKLLLLFLVIVLIGLAYYYFIDQNVRSSVASSQADAASAQTELKAVEQKLMQLSSIKKTMDELEEAGKLSYMGSYNNSKAEVAFLNDILAQTENYSISFSDVTRNGEQIRRYFVLQYQTKNYAAAEEITRKLCEGEYRCLVGDVKCNVSTDGKVTINESATFYETMAGGTPDAGLPENNASVKQ